MLGKTYFQDKLDNFTCKHHPSFKVTKCCFDINCKHFLLCPQCLVEFPEILLEFKESLKDMYSFTDVLFTGGDVLLSNELNSYINKAKVLMGSYNDETVRLKGIVSSDIEKIKKSIIQDVEVYFHELKQKLICEQDNRNVEFLNLLKNSVEIFNEELEKIDKSVLKVNSLVLSDLSETWASYDEFTDTAKNYIDKYLCYKNSINEQKSVIYYQG